MCCFLGLFLRNEEYGTIGILASLLEKFGFAKQSNYPSNHWFQHKLRPLGLLWLEEYFGAVLATLGVVDRVPIVFVSQRRPLWFCQRRVCCVTISTDRAKDTFPCCQIFFRVVQVFVCFAGTPRWQFTPGTLLVGNFY